MKRITKYFILAFICSTSGPLLGITLSKTEQSNLASINARSEYYRISNNGVSITGIAVSGGLTYALKKNLSAGLRYGQAYSAKDNFSSLFSSLHFEVGYALRGGFSLINSEVTLDHKRVAQIKSKPLWNIYCKANVNQYTYNYFNQSIPFSGFGGELSVEYTLGSWGSITSGLTVDRIINADAVLYPTKAFLGWNTHI